VTELLKQPQYRRCRWLAASLYAANKASSTTST
jgi:hypothetical protein